MADVTDKADAITETFFNAALSRRAPEGPPYNGSCYNCSDAVEFPNRWCDEACKADWERRERKELGPLED